MNLNISIPNLLWNLIVIASASFLAIFIPLSFVIDLRNFESYFFLNSAVTLIFFLDIIVNIYSLRKKEHDAFFGENTGLEYYFKHWFAIDFIAFIPIGLFIHPSLLQLVRLVKLAKVAYIMHQLRRREIQYSFMLSLMFFVFWIVHFAHWVACGWLALRGISEDITIFDNYIKSLYWTVTTITTVGYGDITPVNSVQSIYVICVEILGVGAYGYLIGKVASFVSARDPRKNQYLDNLDNLATLTKLRKLPLQLQRKIRDYYTYMFNQKLGYDESKFLEGLPKSLQLEVSMHLKKEALEKIPLFTNKHQSFLKEVALHLTPQVFTPGDYIFREGDEGQEMYFVVSGELEVLRGERENTLSILRSGDFFGEIALFDNQPRNAAIRAKTYCDLYKLSKSRFDHVLSKFPSIANEIKIKADARRR